jgi:hypothetical protein
VARHQVQAGRKRVGVGNPGGIVAAAKDAGPCAAAEQLILRLLSGLQRRKITNPVLVEVAKQIILAGDVDRADE